MRRDIETLERVAKALKKAERLARQLEELRGETCALVSSATAVDVLANLRNPALAMGSALAHETKKIGERLGHDFRLYLAD